ncbi:condensation domain-containing protein [Streptomyces sp. NPDC088350]|uniref:condensation domain-containing protein n=1 Tax=Streptomyces sp. NPDC088350 TaxID=3365854 RepID=UPI00381644ED
MSTTSCSPAERNIVRANDAFRPRFAERDGTPYERTDGSPPDVEVLDLSGDTDPEASCEAWIADESVRPFDLNDGPPSRPVLLRETDTTVRIFLAAHLLITDAWGPVPLLRPGQAGVRRPSGGRAGKLQGTVTAAVIKRGLRP